MAIQVWTLEGYEEAVENLKTEDFTPEEQKKLDEINGVAQSFLDKGFAYQLFHPSSFKDLCMDMYTKQDVYIEAWKRKSIPTSSKVK